MTRRSVCSLAVGSTRSVGIFYRSYARCQRCEELEREEVSYELKGGVNFSPGRCIEGRLDWSRIIVALHKTQRFHVCPEWDGVKTPPPGLFLLQSGISGSRHAAIPFFFRRRFLENTALLPVLQFVEWWLFSVRMVSGHHRVNLSLPQLASKQSGLVLVRTIAIASLSETSPATAWSDYMHLHRQCGEEGWLAGSFLAYIELSLCPAEAAVSSLPCQVRTSMASHRSLEREGDGVSDELIQSRSKTVSECREHCACTLRSQSAVYLLPPPHTR